MSFETHAEPLLVRGAEVYAPAPLGVLDVLCGGGRVLAIGRDLTAPSALAAHEIDGRGHKLLPGLIDGHVHIAGAGGEGGPLEVKPSTAIRELLEAEVPLENITMNSDACGSLPEFDAKGKLVRLTTALLDCIWREITEAVGEGIALEIAVQVATSNPAASWGLPARVTSNPAPMPT